MRHALSTARTALLALALTAAAGLAAVAGTASPAAATTSGDLQDAFADAAREFGVPANLLLAVSYQETRWETHAGRPSTAGGYGPMHLTDVDPAWLPKGADAASVRVSRDPALHTLDAAARLTGADPGALRADARENIRGGAALLASYARELGGGRLPADPGGWYAAVARYSGAADEATARMFADDVYATLRSGAARTTGDGQVVRLPADPGVRPDTGGLAALRLRPAPRPRGAEAPECPPTLACAWIPAAYQLNDPADPTDYGNYDTADRPRDLPIEYIVLHDTEETYDSTLQIFTNPRSYVSAHYVVRSQDGFVAQMVRTKDVAWQAGNWYVNTHSIGIEQEGFLHEPDAWFTEAMYRSTARLVRYLHQRFGVPLDRGHVIGHDNVPGTTPARVPGMHYDPGPYWDWAHFMELVGAPLRPQAGPDAPVVTIAPDYATNQPPVSSCDPTPCRDMPAHPASFVYLRTEPRPDAPLLSDPALHPDGSPGTTRAEDWGDKASTGQRFAVAERRGDWTAIWFAGQKAWLYDPREARVTLPARGVLVTPKPGVAAIPVYGRPLPEPAAYPPEIPVQPVTPLQYTIPAGQKYLVLGPARADYYYSPTYDASRPGDHTVVRGADQYLLISFGHRLGYVRATDVVAAR